MTARGVSVAALVALASIAASGRVHADEPSLERAQALFRAGAQAYAKGDFKGASLAFEEAYGSTPRPGILFSIAQAHRKQFYVDKDPAELRAAIAHYREYLEKSGAGPHRADAAQALVELEPQAQKLETAAAPPPAPAKPRTRVMISTPIDGARVSLDDGPEQPTPLLVDVEPGKHKVRVAADGYAEDVRRVQAVDGVLVAVEVPLEERRARLAIRAEAGAEIIVDRTLVGRTPLAAPLELTPGRHFVALTRNGRRPYSVELDLGRGEQRALDVDLPISGQRLTALAMLATAAGGALVGGIFTGLAFDRQSTAQDLKKAIDTSTVGQPVVDAYRSAAAARDDDKRVATIAFGAAAAIALSGGALFVLDTPRAPTPPSSDHDSPRRPPRAPVPIEIGLTPAGLGATVTGRF